MRLLTSVDFKTEKSRGSLVILAPPALGDAPSVISWFITPSNFLVGGLEHVFIFHILGISSSQLTFIFFRGVGQPPTSFRYRKSTINV